MDKARDGAEAGERNGRCCGANDDAGHEAIRTPNHRLLSGTGGCWLPKVAGLK